MARKQLAALAALTLISTPALAFDSLSQPSSGVTFYFSIPLDAQKAKEQVPNFGMLFRGSREYQVVNVDSRMINNFALGGIEAKWIIAGVVAAGAVVAVASKDKSTSTSYQQQQHAQQQQMQQNGDPCVTPQPQC